MLRASKLLACFALAAMSPLFAAGEKLPAAETVLEKYIEKIGGRAALEKLRTQVLTGTVEFTGRGMTGNVTVYRAAPDKTLTVMELPGIGKMEEGVAGDVAWSRSAMQGPRLKQGEEKAAAVRAADFHSELNWRKHYTKVEVAGVEDVNGKPCYKLVMTPAAGKPVTRYYERASGLAVRSSLVVATPMGDIPIESYTSDYRDAGGLLLAHKVTQKLMATEIVLTFASISNNVEIDPGRFALPPEVKALIK